MADSVEGLYAPRTLPMLDAMLKVPTPLNEPVKTYAPRTPERAALQTELQRMRATPLDVPMLIDGREIRTSETLALKAPHDHALDLGRFHQGSGAHVEQAIEAALRAAPMWSSMPWNARAAVFLKAAELLATTHRQRMNASTMLGQSKTAHQSEIDAVCELVDFLRFNCAYLTRLVSEQPESAPGVWNQLDHRPLEGFVLAISPFNFTSIAANLPAAPALMGNTVVWKPSLAAMHSAHHILKLFEEAGMPPGVINMVTGDPQALVDHALAHPSLAGVHFTGSTAVFRALGKTVGDNLSRYRSYPRIVGETGGKDFVFAHASADPDALAVALLRGAYEYQGQKCSAASRAYVPSSVWPGVRDRLVAMIDEVRVGDVCDFSNFMGAVIDERAYTRLTSYVDRAAKDPKCNVLRAGASREKGWFVRPTLIEVSDPAHELLRDELFGPVLSVLVYPDAEVDRALARCDEGSPYALTGAVFARDRAFIEHASRALRNAAGNFYINDKPTGAVVGQQPFGGARASGTNDKAGSVLNLLRWVSPRTIKETFAPPTAWRYPFMDE